IKTVPSHRVLAIFRGRNEGVLKISLLSDKEMIENSSFESSCQKILAEHFSILDKQCPADQWLASVVQWTWRVKLQTHLENEFFKRLKDDAEVQAIDIFAKNLKDLLMAAPAGDRIVMGLDPALRTGVKVVVTDVRGQLLTHTVIYPHAPQNQWDQSLRKLTKLCEMYKVSLISIGNGTGSRETERLVKAMIKEFADNKPEFMIISEAGASVYSASELASKEFPDLDVSIRGAVSIARRIQDPLSELVKIDPKAIGVGEYQHDVNQRMLSRSLDAVVEDCVNAVGVDLNIASAQVLSKVAGLTTATAENIVNYRNENGSFSSRKQLLKIDRLGEKAFEQCAGFLRINNGENPLDASAVHPEAYSIVEKVLAQSAEKSLQSIIGDRTFLQNIEIENFTDDSFGAITIRDIISELEKPGRDPRPVFKTVTYKDGVESIKDLHTNMNLEGVVSNVTNFGAFVDIGVHRDGLIHISALSSEFVSDPRTVVKAGDIVSVWITEVDVARNRIGLSMVHPDKLQNNQPKASNTPTANNKRPGQLRSNQVRQKQKNHQKDVPISAFASALSSALKSKN
ncbi:MAG: RNA-binding transcriptional accessory protein, partial [Gammaproteobacteria bacterium]|nr:RNA-binding transcriptional accessory protein [Gammaproteobacteria bacterium]